MPTDPITVKPTFFEVEITAAGEAVRFQMPRNAVWWSMKVRTAGGKVRMSHEGTEGEPITDNYATVDAPGGFSLPDASSFSVSVGDI
jgi:hypothetical protein